MYTNDLDNCSRRVLIYVNKEIVSKKLELDLTFQEYVTIELKAKNSKVIVCNIYRSPNSTVENDKNSLYFIERISQKSSAKLLLLGDFNLSDINWDLQTAITSLSQDFIGVSKKNASKR